MNPTPSGEYFDSGNSKQSFYKTQQYLSKLSQPLLDRIDLQIEVESVSIDELTIRKSEEEDSKMIRNRVQKARNIQFKRQLRINAHLDNYQLKKYCKLNEETLSFLRNASKSLNISARSFTRIKKIARTIADLDGCKNIVLDHIAEAIQYRSLEKLKQFFN